MDFTKCVTLMAALLLLGACLPTEACRCGLPEHLQARFCKSNAVIKVKFIKESKTEEEFGYVIQISEVLRGDETLQNSTFIHTLPSSASCEYGHTDGELGTDYVAIVYSDNDEINVGSCDFVKLWSALMPEQKTGLKGAYKPGCDTCKIVKSPNTACTAPPCEAAKQCVWVDENHAKDKACLPEGASCAWKTI